MIVGIKLKNKFLFVIVVMSVISVDVITSQSKTTKRVDKNGPIGGKSMIKVSTDGSIGEVVSEDMEDDSIVEEFRKQLEGEEVSEDLIGKSDDQHFGDEPGDKIIQEITSEPEVNSGDYQEVADDKDPLKQIKSFAAIDDKNNGSNKEVSSDSETSEETGRDKSDAEEFRQKLEEGSGEELSDDSDDQHFREEPGDKVIEEITSAPEVNSGDYQEVDDDKDPLKPKSYAAIDNENESTKNHSTNEKSDESVSHESDDDSGAERFRQQMEGEDGGIPHVIASEDNSNDKAFGEEPGDVVIQEITYTPEVNSEDYQEVKDDKTADEQQTSGKVKNYGALAKASTEVTLIDMTIDNEVAEDADAEAFRQHLQQHAEDVTEDNKNDKAFREEPGEVVIKEITIAPDLKDDETDDEEIANKKKGSADESANVEDDHDVNLKQSANTGGGQTNICGADNRPEIIDAFRVSPNHVIIVAKSGQSVVYYKMTFTYTQSSHDLKLTDIKSLDTDWSTNNVNQTFIQVFNEMSFWFPSPVPTEVYGVGWHKEDDIDQLLGYTMPSTIKDFETIPSIGRVIINPYKYVPASDPNNILSLFQKFPDIEPQKRFHAITNFPDVAASGLPKRYFVYYMDKAEDPSKLPAGDTTGWSFKRHIIIAATTTYGPHSVLEWQHDVPSGKCVDSDVVNAAFTLSDAYQTSGQKSTFDLIEITADKYFIKTVSLDATAVDQKLSDQKNGNIGDLFGCGPPTGLSTTPASGGPGGPGGDTSTPITGDTHPSKDPLKTEDKSSALLWILIIIALLIVLAVICLLLYCYCLPFRSAVNFILCLTPKEDNQQTVQQKKPSPAAVESGQKSAANPSGVESGQKSGANPSGESLSANTPSGAGASDEAASVTSAPSNGPK